MAKAKVKEEDGVEEKDTKSTGDEDGGEGGAEGDAGGHGGEKKSKKKMIILGGGALVLLLAAGGGAYYMGFFNKHEEKVEGAELGADGKPIEKAIFYTLPEFLINLNSGKQQTFLKATVILEVAHQGDVPQIEANLPRLLDTLNTYLRELRPSDLAGSAGIQRLREELLLRANKTMAPVKINDILFKEIIVQ